MSKRYLQAAYRQGKPFAAYLYLDRRPGDKTARTERHGSWVIDFALDGRAIGIEFTTVGTVDLSEINRALAAAHHPSITETDLVPLQAT